MHILFVGGTEGHECSSYYYASMIHMGHCVYALSPHLFEDRSVWEKIQRNPSHKRIQKLNDTLTHLLKVNRFDLVFVMAENFIFPEVIRDARKYSRSKLHWMYHSHDNVFSRGILSPGYFWSALREYDVVATTKSQNIRRYQELGCTRTLFVPSAYEPRVHKRLSLNESQLNGLNFPVSFIGTYDYSRDPFLEAVGWDRLYTWGNGWNRYKYYAHHLDRISNQAVYHWEYSDILNHSQIALGLLREEAQDLHTQRTFEIPACGAFQLAPRNDELLQFFTEDREIVCFSTLDELKDKVSYYLKNPDERNRIAKAGWEKCLSGKHSYQDRVQSFLECIPGSALAVDTRIREESFEAATAR